MPPSFPSLDSTSQAFSPLYQVRGFVYVIRIVQAGHPAQHNAHEYYLQECNNRKPAVRGLLLAVAERAADLRTITLLKETVLFVVAGL